MNRQNPYTQESIQTVELTEAQANFKELVNTRKRELRNKYFDFKRLRVTVTGAGGKTIRLSYNVNGLSSKGVTNCNFYLDWDDEFLEKELVPQINEFLGVEETEDVPSISLEELMGE